MKRTILFIPLLFILAVPVSSQSWHWLVPSERRAREILGDWRTDKGETFRIEAARGSSCGQFQMVGFENITFKIKFSSGIYHWYQCSGSSAGITAGGDGSGAWAVGDGYFEIGQPDLGRPTTVSGYLSRNVWRSTGVRRAHSSFSAVKLTPEFLAAEARAKKAAEEKAKQPVRQRTEESAKAAAPTTSITIAANSSSPAFEPMESKFRTAFNAATDSERRGKALGVLFGDIYKNTSLTDEQKKNYLRDKMGQVYALDKEAVFQGFMKAECSSKEMIEVMKVLPADQKAFILKRANQVVDGFKVVKQ